MKTGKVHRVEVALGKDGVWRLAPGAIVPPLEAGDIIKVWSPAWEEAEQVIPGQLFFSPKRRRPWWLRHFYLVAAAVVAAFCVAAHIAFMTGEWGWW